MYQVRKTFGGYEVIDAEGNRVGDVYDGTGAKARAEEAATALNGGEAPTEAPEEESPEYVRGSGREGRRL